MEGCIFCTILRDGLMSKVYEDEKTVAFMDIAKDVDGHIVVIPKKHVKNILDCDAETPEALMRTVQKVSRHLTEDCGYDGVDLLNASDESAGQSVPHFHIHIIPRRKGDGIDAWPKFVGAKRELGDVWKEIRFR